MLKSRAEYNRCAVLRLSSKIGEKDYKRWKKKAKQNKEKDDILKEKLRRMKIEKEKKLQESRKKGNTGK